MLTNSMFMKRAECPKCRARIYSTDGCVSWCASCLEYVLLSEAKKI